MKFLIAGLGNIGDEFANTRHNIGFSIADELVKTADSAFSVSRHAMTAEIKIRGKKVIVIKPSTYMNLSGKAISYWLQFEKIPVENLFVITDDLALPFGKIRIRKTGSDGGHNGLAHIVEMLGTIQFARLRFGIGSEFERGGQSGYVLSRWTPEEEKLLPERIKKCMDAVKFFVHAGIGETMNRFNNK